MEKQKNEITETTEIDKKGYNTMLAKYAESEKEHLYDGRLLTFKESGRKAIILPGSGILASLFMLDQLAQFNIGLIISWWILLLSIIATFISELTSLKDTDARLLYIWDFMRGDEEAFERQRQATPRLTVTMFLNYASLSLCIVGICLLMVLFSLSLFQG
jgi:hypothetical protein